VLAQVTVKMSGWYFKTQRVFTFPLCTTDYWIRPAIKCTCYKSSAVAEMGDRSATIGMGRKWGGAAVGLCPHWVPI